MTQISRDDVLKLASLSGLQLDDNETTELQKDLLAILGYVKQLDELDTTGIEPAYQVTGLTNVLRADMVEQAEIDRETLLDLAYDTNESQVKVPKVL